MNCGTLYACISLIRFFSSLASSICNAHFLYKTSILIKLKHVGIILRFIIIENNEMKLNVFRLVIKSIKCSSYTQQQKIYQPRK
jgi:hypothetical protein